MMMMMMMMMMMIIIKLYYIVWGFEDVLESHVVDQILPQLESSSGDLSFSVDLRSLPGY